MSFEVLQFKVGAMSNFTYLFWDETNVGGIVDPSYGAMVAVEEAKKRGIRVELVLVTHDHPDHVSDLDAVVKACDAWVAAYDGSPLDVQLGVKDGQGILLGNGVIEVIHTPGHTPDSICYLVDGNLFTGDTLFVGECGRTDLLGGSNKDMYHSLFEKLAELPDETMVWPGHDYGKAKNSTMGKERAESYIFTPKRTVSEFVEFMKEP